MMRRNFTIDTLLQLKDAGLVAASARAQVAGADQILDLGAGFVEGNIVIDVSAIEIDGGDEIYDLIVQLSSDSDFSDKTAVVERLAISLSAKEVKRSDSDIDDDAACRIVIPFDNEWKGTVYRYLSLYTAVGGVAVATGINYTAYLCKRNAG